MRIPSIPIFLRTLYTLNATTVFRRSTTTSFARISHSPHVHRSMSGIPFLGALFGTSTKNMADSTNYPVSKPEGEWQTQLSPEQFRILRKKGTEAPGSGKYDKHYPDTGVYTCAGCDAPLYKANHKFDSGCGWPAFWDAVPNAVGQKDDSSLGMRRTEIVCNNCGGHLGHISKVERFGNPKDERHCVNSISINFGPEKGESKADGKTETE